MEIDHIADVGNNEPQDTTMEGNTTWFPSYVDGDMDIEMDEAAGLSLDEARPQAATEIEAQAIAEESNETEGQMAEPFDHEVENPFQTTLDGMDELSRVLIEQLLNQGRAITLDWSAQPDMNPSPNPAVAPDVTRQGIMDDDGEDHDGDDTDEHHGSDEGDDPNADPNRSTPHFAWVDRRDAATETTKCPACTLEVAPNEIVYLVCGHPWCKDCLNNHLRASLSSRQNYPSRCCRSTPNGIDLSVIQAYLDEDVLFRLIDVGEEYASKDPKFCFDPKCSAFIPVPETESQQTAQWVTCQRCKRVTCTECKGDKDLHPTPEQHPDLISKEDRELAEKEGWKQCPNRKCRKMIERTEGCDHMKCECGTHFCYQCGRHLGGRDVTEMACNCRGQNPWVNRLEQWQFDPNPEGEDAELDSDLDSDSDLDPDSDLD
ncbi:hypothetical protein DL762_004073 [Monosporascus cannonballus]|uniref:RBR-type E3 ubiquitin transferase n=1 Tax=Monosporascus cannonballus TaxID=155416 RepID=A0ABY0H8U4_9PEZI|nr:hypothetical protein DL762_004073 [Monosporascus cannonballus]